MDFRDKNVDCYSDGQFKITLRPESSKTNQVLFDIGPKYQRLKMEKFRSRACNKIETILDSKRIPNRDQTISTLEDAITEKDLCQHQEFIQSYILDYLNSELSTDFNSQPKEFEKFQKILKLLFQYSLKILNDENLNFVDHDQEKENECVIWAELFHFLHFLFRNTRNSHDFFDVHNKLVNEEELINGKETFAEKIRLKNFFMKILTRVESFKVVYSLSILFGLEKIIRRSLSNCENIEEEMKLNPFWIFLPRLKEYFLGKSLEKFKYFSPVMTREIFYRLVEIVRSYSAHKGEDFKLKDKVQMILIELDLKALKQCKNISFKVNVVKDIGLSLMELKENRRNEEIEISCKKLIQEDYFSIISTHHECIKFSVEFINYCLTFTKEEEIKFFINFKKMEIETLIELVNIQTCVEFIQESTLRQQIQIMKSFSNPNMQVAILRLLLIQFKISKNIKEFLQNISEIPNLSNDVLGKEFKNLFLKENFINKEVISLILKNSYLNHQNLVHFLEVEILNSITNDFLLKFDMNYNYFDFVFDIKINSRYFEQKKVIFEILIKKNNILFKNRLNVFIYFIKQDRSWIQNVCSLVIQGLGERVLENILSQLFLADDIETDFSDAYVEAFQIVVQKSLIQKNKEISEKVVFKAIELYFSEQGISGGVRENFRHTFLFMLKYIKAEDNHHIKNKLKNKMRAINDVRIFFPFLTDEYIKKCFRELITTILFSKLQENNVDQINSIFMKSFDSYQIITTFYNPLESNEWQDFVMIHPSLSITENIYHISKKNITYPKLAQRLLEFYPNHENNSNFCSLLLKTPFEKLEKNKNVQKSLLEFIENADNSNFLDDLINRILEDDDNGICDLAKLLKKAIKKDKSRYLYFLNKINGDKEKLLLSRKIKEISGILVDLFTNEYETELNNLVLYIYQYGQNQIDEFSKPSLLLLSCLQMVVKFLKKGKILHCFYTISAKLKEWVKAEHYFYPKSIEVRSLVYKIFFAMNDAGIIHVIKEQGSKFFLERQNVQPTKIQKYTQSLKDGQKGFENKGMVCYLNTCLILLSDHQEFQHSLISKYSWDKPLLTSVLYLLAKLQYSYLSSTNAAKSLMKFPDLAISLTEQKDASEFLNTLLLFLSLENGEEINKPLEVILSSSIKCDECKTESHNQAKENLIMLEFNDNESIASKMNNFKETVRFEGQNMYECSNCGGKKNATKVTKFKYLPDTFIAYIKRFSYEVATGNQVKLNTKVKIDSQVVVNTEDQGDVLYYLKGIVIHNGSVQAGHYFYFKKNDEGWTYINDKKTELLKNFQPERFEEFLFDFNKESTNPYLLIYSRQPKINNIEFPQNILQKVQTKNLKYLTITRFTRSDLVELIIQFVNVSKDYDTGMYYLFNYYSNIYESNENFLKNSKKLLKVFEGLNDDGKCLDFIKQNIENIWAWGNVTNHYNYIKFEVIKILLSKANYEQHEEFYKIFISLFQQKRTGVNLTFVFNLFAYIGTRLLNIQVKEIVKYTITFFVTNVSINQLEYSFIYNLIASNCHTLDEFYDDFANHLQTFLQYTSPNSLEQLAFVLSKFYNRRNEILVLVWNSQNSIKLKVLFYIFNYIGRENKQELYNYKNYHDWIFKELPEHDVPRIIKFAKTFYNDTDFHNLYENKVHPILQSKLTHLEGVQEEIKLIFNDISLNKEIFIEVQGEKEGEFFRDPSTSKVYKIVGKARDVILIKSDKESETQIKVLYHN